MADKPELSQEFFLKLLGEILSNKKEEREMALDRWIRTDEKMQTNDQLAIVGKTAVDFLKLASTCTNDMAKLLTEIRPLIKEFKELLSEKGGNTNINVNEVTDDMMKKIIDRVKDNNENGNGNDINDVENK